MYSLHLYKASVTYRYIYPNFRDEAYSQAIYKILECTGLQKFGLLSILDHLFYLVELLVLVLEKIIPTHLLQTSGYMDLEILA